MRASAVEPRFRCSVILLAHFTTGLGKAEKMVAMRQDPEHSIRATVWPKTGDGGGAADGHHPHRSLAPERCTYAVLSRKALTDRPLSS